MKMPELKIKEVLGHLTDGFQLICDTIGYWSVQLHRTTKGVVLDTFALNVAGGIQDFVWEEGDTDLNQREAVSRKVTDPAVDHSIKNFPGAEDRRGEMLKSNKPVKSGVGLTRTLLKPVKLILRWIFLDLPELFSREKKVKEPLNPYENRIRRST